MIGKFEANKDLIQELTSSGARHVGNIATIITGTVQEVTREIGEWITDAIEMNEAAAAAKRDAAAGPIEADADDQGLDAEPRLADPADDPRFDAAAPPASYVEAEIVEPESDGPR
ncbi:hypothetical protein [Nocardia cyriacigeorgica]|jgi:hypothetical protein|uniref:hypothetical protein n=1 Tax=Nocardia cyriacigeorgica TaxID=135487 RepID=UPI0013D191EB|nr:hypothetical protein [Nocardia cyriacigeorgica]MBF6439961.1 hypothetical protein [Nocardia cyriacigeorgica]MBF6455988.1 hypothetical protein [Nocardia cyriacigeorgica]MBF6479435.1 hypothetical protein [Nocardia cyriacigeorgica]MBF6553271.1 hypothetical protein [Nocardia cyriacigeorgica]NEW28931.1 hypothetical protein [Nocardia cyriacigeorgica]